MNSPAEPIVIPMNKAGERAFELLRSIAEKYLNIARTAADGLISTEFPNSEKVEEMPMLECRYSAVYEAYGGVRRTVTYDYITKEVYFERT